MNADSDIYRQIASQISSHIAYGFFFKKAYQIARHNEIQYRLSNLSSYFTQSANSIDNNEMMLMNTLQNTLAKTNVNVGTSPIILSPNPVSNSHLTFSQNMNWKSIFNKEAGKSYLGVKFNYAYHESNLFNYHSKYFNSRMDFDIGNVLAIGKTEFSVWKDKVFNPDVELNASFSGTVFSTNLNTSLGNSKANVTLDARGDVGSVYANAKGVLNFKEQTLDLGVGAAAARGEVACSFKLFGAKITLTGEGSIGSAEANLSYSHKNREWEFGSKLGFIAGLGFKVHVSY